MFSARSVSSSAGTSYVEPRLPTTEEEYEAREVLRQQSFVAPLCGFDITHPSFDPALDLVNADTTPTMQSSSLRRGVSFALAKSLNVQNSDPLGGSARSPSMAARTDAASPPPFLWESEDPSSGDLTNAINDQRSVTSLISPTGSKRPQFGPKLSKLSGLSNTPRDSELTYTKRQSELVFAVPQRPWDHWYGFVVAASVHVIQFSVYGTMNSYSTFSHEMVEDSTLQNPSETNIALALSLANGISPLIAVFAGSVSDHLGPRVVLCICTGLLALGLVAASFAGNTFTLLLYFTVPVTLAASVRAPAAGAVASWLKTRLSLGMGIAIGGNGSGSSIIVPVAGVLASSTLGWRNAFRLLALFPIMGFVASLFVTFRVPPTPRPAFTRRDLLFFKNLFSNGTYWTVFCVASLYSFTLFSSMFYIVPFARLFGESAPYKHYDRIPHNYVGTLFTFFGVANWLGAFTLGAIAQKTEPRLVCALCCAMGSFACCLWGVCTRYEELAAVSAVLGFSVAGFFAMIPAIAGRCFQGPRLGLAVGMCMLGYGVGGTLGPPLIAYIRHTQDGSMTLGFSIMALTAALASAIAYFGLEGRVTQQAFARTISGLDARR